MTKKKRGSKFRLRLRGQDPFAIRSVSVSPEHTLRELALSIRTSLAPAPQTHQTTEQESALTMLKPLVSIATNVWRAKRKMVDPATGEPREDMKGVNRHVEAIYRTLGDLGIEIRDHTGDAYDEGQPLKVIAYKVVPGLKTPCVSETLLPSIYWKNRLVQNGEVEIATASSTDTSTESHLPTP
jgi:hypothetical protein